MVQVEKIPTSRRGKSKDQFDFFETQLKTLFDISPLDVEDRLRSTRLKTWKEDYQFLFNQRKIHQQGFMTGLTKNCSQEKIVKEKRTDESQRNCNETSAGASANPHTARKIALSDDDCSSTQEDCQEEE